MCRPKPSAALFRLSKLAEKLPRSVFRLRRASRPYPLRGTLPRTTNRRHRRINPPRAAYARPLATASRLGFASGNPTPSARANLASAILAPSWIFEDATRTPRLGARIFLRVGGDFGDTTTHDDRTRGGAWRFEGRGGSIGSFRVNRVERVERGTFKPERGSCARPSAALWKPSAAL